MAKKQKRQVIIKSIGFPPDEHETILRVSKESERSYSATVRHFIKLGMDKDQKK